MEDKSKSARKRDAIALQKMAIEICQLSQPQIAKLDLPRNLLTAILDYKKMNSNGALRRQAQYIGKIMRDMEPEQFNHLNKSLNNMKK